MINQDGLLTLDGTPVAIVQPVGTPEPSSVFILGAVLVLVWIAERARRWLA